MLISTVIAYVAAGMNLMLALMSLSVIRRAKGAFALGFATCGVIGLIAPPVGLIVNVMELMSAAGLFLYLMYDGFRTMHW